ncbi:MAG: N-acetylmuramoyl-L-alanine amidase [Devosia sp.]|nr:N-acetylmuramoyl-L-alanine amidase [Devosia sp.]
MPRRNVVSLLARLAITLLLLTLGAAGAVAQQAAASDMPLVVGARVTTTPERARLILDLSAPSKFAIVSLDNPARIAVDLRAGALKFDTPPPAAGTGLVTSYSVAMAEAGRARATISLSGPAQVQQAYVLDAFGDQPARLVVDLIPDTPEGFARRVAIDVAAQKLSSGAAMADNSTPPGGTEASPAPASAPAAANGGAAPPKATATPAAAASAAVAAAPAGSVAPTASVAEASGAPAGQASTQAAAKPKPLIVLDPGHGGIDNGATAPNGVHEKNITLAFALKLQALLVKSGRYDVALTRTDDAYMTLEQRVALARQNKADLLISIHADTFGQPQIHGTSIYTRDEMATDVLDKVLADNENKFDIVSGFAVPKMTPAVVDVLVDLMRRQMRKQSFMAAESIISALQPSFQLRRFPVRQADFFVLQAPDVPSMLIELGFLSNSDDISNLTDAQWQDRAAAAIARGIGAYFDEMAQPAQTAQTAQP